MSGTQQGIGAGRGEAKRARPLEGVAWMLASGLSFVCVNAIVHALGTGLPAAQSAFLRFAWGVVFLLPVMARLGREARVSLQVDV